MKRFIAIALTVLMVLSLCTAFVACGKDEKGSDEGEAQEPVAENDLKVGAILVGDENEGYTQAHMDGIKAAAKACGLKDEQIIWKKNIKEDETCYDAAIDLVHQGCQIIFANSFGHEDYMIQAARENPDVLFCHATGQNAAKQEGVNNIFNYFTGIYEARYVSGIVAGMKLKELMDEGKVTDPHIGYVGAYPYAEVVSGYTGFFLGIKSIVPTAHMDVQYTNSWFNITAESEAAKALIERGCIIIGQHADSTGAPATCEEYLTKKNTTVYSVGYNVDMLANAPTAALTSPTNEWVEYYTYAIGAVLKGEKFDTNWAKGFADDAVAVTKLGPSCAPGTQEKVDELIAAFKAGKLNVFDTNTFTVGGVKVEEAFATDTDGDWVNDADNAVFDGYYHESYFQSAPSFSLRIDGITELN
jgi:basic membrane protein A